MRKRVFISFDYHHDKKLKDVFIAQSRLPRAPFCIADLSLKEKRKLKTWERKARKQIKEAGVVLVVLGDHTHRANGVKKEVVIARRLGRRVVQVQCKKRRRAKPVRNAGPVRPWKWTSLKKVLDS